MKFKIYMIIGIVGAIKEELILLRQQLTDIKTKNFGGCKVYYGNISSIRVIIIETGVGKVSASLGTTILISYFLPNLVINIGLAGSLVPYIKKHDLVISQSTCYYDVNVTSFGYKIGQVPKHPLIFNTPKHILSIAKIFNKKEKNIFFGLIISGDNFINNTSALNNIRNNFPKALVVDMESTAIAQVCYRFNIPFISIKQVSDHADNIANIEFMHAIKNIKNNLFVATKNIILNLNTT
ncbi:MAG: 5'-methylthioadenosine/adenosylhomocysteine nucleosidase [Candidatus Lightella neohaematopini]|nr:5'-methylthioadenosine/adenosylhomocysteine nucleosidase [Candidatus Lightella neohaematopini]